MTGILETVAEQATLLITIVLIGYIAATTVDRHLIQKRLRQLTEKVEMLSDHQASPL